jgi:hypothetical protein
MSWSTPFRSYTQWTAALTGLFLSARPAWGEPNSYDSEMYALLAVYHSLVTAEILAWRIWLRIPPLLFRFILAAQGITLCTGIGLTLASISEKLRGAEFVAIPDPVQEPAAAAAAPVPPAARIPRIQRILVAPVDAA